MTMTDDCRLVEATLCGELEAFAELVRQYQQPLIASARQLIRRAEDAEDLAQETLLSAYQRLRQLRDRHKFRPWLFTILRHKCLDYLRSNEAEECSLETCAEIEVTPKEFDGDELVALLHRLPFADREILAARYLYELEYDEIARALGCSIRAARMRCQRGRERLRTLMLQADEEETLRTLKQAMTALTAGLMGDSFVNRVLQEVRPLNLPAPPATGLPKPPALHLPAAHIWLSAGGWKALAGVAAALTIAGLSPHFLAAGHRGVARAAVVQTSVIPTEIATSPQTVAAPIVAPLLAAHPIPAPVATPTPAPTPVTHPQLAGTGSRRMLIAAQPAAHTLPVATPAETPQIPTMVFQVGNSRSVFEHMQLSPDGSRLATCTSDEIVIWEPATGLIAGRLSRRDLMPGSVGFSPDNHSLFCSTRDSGYFTWNLGAGHWQQILQNVTEPGLYLPDGKHLLTMRNPTMPAGFQGTAYQITQRDARSGNEICHGLVAGNSVSWSDDGARYAIFNGKGVQTEYAGLLLAIEQAKILDLRTGKTIDLDYGNAPTPIMGTAYNPGGVFSPDGSRFAGIDYVKEKPYAFIWDASSGKLINFFPAQTDNTKLALSVDGAKLAYAGNDGTITVCDVGSGKQLQLPWQGKDEIRELCFTPDGKSLLALRAYQQPSTVQIYNLATGQMSHKLVVPYEQQPLGDIIASPDGRLLAVGVGNTVMLWDLTKGLVIREFPVTDSRYHLAMSPNGKLLAVTQINGVIQVLDVSTGASKTLTGRYLQAAFSPDNTLLAAGGADGAVSIWHLGDRTAGTLDRESPGWVSEVAFSPDGTKLAWIHTEPLSSNGKLTIWDIPTGTKIVQEADKEYYFDNLAFSPNGRWVMATHSSMHKPLGSGGLVCCWDAATGKPSASLQMPADEKIRFARFTPDSKQLIGESDGKIICWDLPSGHRRPAVKLSDEHLRYMLPAGKNTLVTCDDNNDIAIRPAHPLLAGTPVPACATLYNFDQDIWLAVSSQGYFDCSIPASKAFCWQYQGELYPYEKFAEQYHRPDLLRKALEATATPDPAPVAHPQLAGTGNQHIVITAQPEAHTLPVSTPADTPQSPKMVFQVASLSIYGHVEQMQLSLDGTRLAIFAPNEIVVWDLTTGLIVSRLSHRNIIAASFSSDDRFLFCSTYDNTYFRWDMRLSRCQQVLQNITERGVFLPGGKHLITVRDLTKPGDPQFSNQITLRDANSGDEICHGLMAENGISISDDGTHYAIFNGKKVDTQHGTFVYIAQAKILDLHTGKTIDLDCSSTPSPLIGSSRYPSGIFSLDGSRFAAAVSTKEKSYVFIWDTRNGKLQNVFPALVDNAKLALNSDGAKLAYVGDGGTITVCDVDNGEQFQLPRQEKDQINELCFTPDGKSLLALEGY